MSGGSGLMGLKYVSALRDKILDQLGDPMQFRVSDAAIGRGVVFLDACDLEGRPSLITELDASAAFELGESLVEASGIAPAENPQDDTLVGGSLSTVEQASLAMALVAQRLEAFKAVTDRLDAVTEFVRARGETGYAPDFDLGKALYDIIGQPA